MKIKSFREDKIRIYYSWTNWTFGIWWDNKKLKSLGIDLGPVEFAFRWGNK